MTVCLFASLDREVDYEQVDYEESEEPICNVLHFIQIKSPYMCCKSNALYNGIHYTKENVQIQGRTAAHFVKGEPQ